MRWQRITHHQQQYKSDCLAACAAMVLQHIGYDVSYKKLCKRLKIGSAGTPFSHLRYLEKWGIAVQLKQETIDGLKRYCEQGVTPIVFVRTGELPYWDENVSHALVVVAVDQKHIYVHDPSFADAPKPIPIGDFDLAWLGMNDKVAILSRS